MAMPGIKRAFILLLFFLATGSATLPDNGTVIEFCAGPKPIQTFTIHQQWEGSLIVPPANPAIRTPQARECQVRLTSQDEPLEVSLVFSNLTMGFTFDSCGVDFICIRTYKFCKTVKEPLHFIVPARSTLPIVFKTFNLPGTHVSIDIVVEPYQIGQEVRTPSGEMVSYQPEDGATGLHFVDACSDDNLLEFCGRQTRFVFDVTSAWQGYISSPAFLVPGFQYSGNLRCALQLVAGPRPMEAIIRLSSFDMEYSEDCENDHICIRTNKFCSARVANRSLQYIVPANKALTLTFNSDGSNGGRGFFGIVYMFPYFGHVVTTPSGEKLTYAPGDELRLRHYWDFCSCQLKMCQQQRTVQLRPGVKWELQSPNYDGHAIALTANEVCQLQLVAGERPMVVSLNFTLFKILKDEWLHCDQDFLCVRSQKLCTLGVSLGQPYNFIVQAKNTLVLGIRSKWAWRHEGFLATVEAQNDESLSYAPGNKSHVAHFDDQCSQWVPDATNRSSNQVDNKEQLVDPKFCPSQQQTFYLPYNTTKEAPCSSIKSQIFNPENVTDLADSESNAQVIYLSTLGRMDAKMQTEETGGDEKTLEFCAHNSPVHEDLAVEDVWTRTLVSPSFDEGKSRYPDNTRCELILRPLAPFTLTVHFSYFDLEPNILCAYDYLFILNDHHCGRDPKGSTLTFEMEAGQRFPLVFQTDHSGQWPGFNVTLVARSKLASSECLLL